MSPRLRDVPAKRELRPRDYWQARVQQAWLRRVRAGGLPGVWRAAWDADPYSEAEVRAHAVDRILGQYRARLAGADAETIRRTLDHTRWGYGSYGLHVRQDGRKYVASNGVVELEITLRDLVDELRADRRCSSSRRSATQSIGARGGRGTDNQPCEETAK